MKELEEAALERMTNGKKDPTELGLRDGRLFLWSTGRLYVPDDAALRLA